MTTTATPAPATTPVPVDVLVVDEDENLRSFVRVVLLLNLETALGATTEAATAEEALDAVGERAPDVVIVGADGDDGLLPAVRALAPEARFVAYSTLPRRRPQWADECLTRGDVIAVRPLIDAVRGDAAGRAGGGG